MFKAKTSSGRCNLCGTNIARIRKSKEFSLSQKRLADKLQLLGLEIDKNAVQRIECGKRFVTDIELVVISHALDVSVDELLNSEKSVRNEYVGVGSSNPDESE